MNLIVKAGVRLIAVFAAVELGTYVLRYLSVLVYSGASGHSLGRDIAIICGIAAVGLLLAWLLWAKSASIAKALLGRVDVNTLSINSSTTDALRLGIRLIGVGLIAASIPALFGQVAYWLASRAPAEQVLSARDVGLWVEMGVRLILGTWMATGAKPVWRSLLKALKALGPGDAGAPEQG